MKELLLWRNEHQLSGLKTQVDDDIYELLKDKKIIGFEKNGEYAYPRFFEGEIKKNGILKRTKTIRLHRWIFEHDEIDIKGKTIDHINHNVLENTRGNLRVCTFRQNCFNRKAHKNNSSGHKNVTKRKKANGKIVYIIGIKNGNKKTSYPRTENLLEAVISANILRKEIQGDFAYVESLDNWTEEEIKAAELKVKLKINEKNRKNKLKSY